MRAIKWHEPTLLLVLLSLVFLPSIQAQQSPTPSAQDQFWDAAQAGDTAAMSRALGAGARIDSLDTRRSPNGRRALNWAALANQVDAIRFLVAHGAPVNAVNLTGFTPLHHAAERGTADAARVLLELGANPKLLTGAGETPEDVARRTNHLDVVAVLASARSQ